MHTVRTSSTNDECSFCLLTKSVKIKQILHANDESVARVWYEHENGYRIDQQTHWIAYSKKKIPAGPCFVNELMWSADVTGSRHSTIRSKAFYFASERCVFLCLSHSIQLRTRLHCKPILLAQKNPNHHKNQYRSMQVWMCTTLPSFIITGTELPQ